MVERIIERHRKNLEDKLSKNELDHIEEIIRSSKENIHYSVTVAFVITTIISFFLIYVLALIMLPFKAVLPSVVFYSSIWAATFVLGILVIYFIHINPEFEKHHHLLLFGLFIVFNFVSVHAAYLTLDAILSVSIGTFASLIPVSVVASFGFLIPYLLYWMLVE